jgi:hypothetical protein
MTSARQVPPGRKPQNRLAFATLVAFALGTVWLAAAVPAPSVSPDFPAYLAKHQAELAPFLEQNVCTTLKDGLHILVSVGGNLLLATALFGWVLDVPLSWGFSTVFAPAYAKLTRALIYACGRLVLALMLTVILSFAALVGVNAGAGLPALMVVAVLAVPAIVVQLFWINYLYRTTTPTSLLFYLTLLAAHALIFVVLVPTMFSKQVDTAITEYMNESVVPCLRTEADKAQHDAAALAAKRDDVQSRATDLQSRITQDQADEQDLQKQIDARKNAPAVLFARLVLLRAQGNLAEAGKGLGDFIAKYPNDPHADAARGQIAAVNQALTAQLALERQQQAETTRATAQARAQLLARAGAGQATLSEMRHALIGKTRAQVLAYFGPPTETGADRWGYGKRMVLDPDTHVARGLTVVFSEGFVQGVDYYYGEAQ